MMRKRITSKDKCSYSCLLEYFIHLDQPIQTVLHIYSCRSKYCGCNSRWRSPLNADRLTVQFSPTFVFSWSSALCELQAIHSKNACLKQRIYLQVFNIYWCSANKITPRWQSVIPLDFAVCMKYIASFSREYQTNDLACSFLPSSS